MQLIGIIAIILVVFIALFMNFSPELGGKLSKDDIRKFQKSKNYKGGKFRNIEESSIISDVKIDWIVNNIKNRNKDTVPKNQLPINKYLIGNGEKTKVIWLGHSTLFIEIDGKKMLLDPMLGNRPSPVPFGIAKRFNEELPIDIKDIKKLDAVLISHDHYDHLDYKTVRRIKDKVSKFYVPLGVGSHLTRWGVEKNKIVELDWWSEVDLDGITIAATPSHHFSGRGLFNRNSTLWCSWVIKGKEKSLFFSGDTGYHNEFKAIGEKYGPFDLTMMECGQYNDVWASIHMTPEQTVRGHIDLKGKVLLPIHWGAFKLSVHSWNEPPLRATSEANKQGVKSITPRIGEEIVLDEKRTFDYWWN